MYETTHQQRKTIKELRTRFDIPRGKHAVVQMGPEYFYIDCGSFSVEVEINATTGAWREVQQ